MLQTVQRSRKYIGFILPDDHTLVQWLSLWPLQKRNMSQKSSLNAIFKKNQVDVNKWHVPGHLAIQGGAIAS